jgi:septum formation protein
MLQEKLKKYNLILASGSPRRQQFLKDLGLNFEVQLKDVAEIYPPHLKAHEITDFLALLKANAFEKDLNKNDILITSDTIVWHKNKALGKPKDKSDALAILQSLMGDTHEVITSVCFKTITKTVVLHEVTKVTFKNLTLQNLHYYIDNFEPFDKAGAYGIQEWIGLVGVAKIEGSYTNVMGLPTAVFFDYLNQLG